jgi:hypothetical protein
MTAYKYKGYLLFATQQGILVADPEGRMAGFFSADPQKIRQAGELSLGFHTEVVADWIDRGCLKEEWLRGWSLEEWEMVWATPTVPTPDGSGPLNPWIHSCRTDVRRQAKLVWDAAVPAS